MRCRRRHLDFVSLSHPAVRELIRGDLTTWDVSTRSPEVGTPAHVPERSATLHSTPCRLGNSEHALDGREDASLREANSQGTAPFQ